MGDLICGLIALWPFHPHVNPIPIPVPTPHTFTILDVVPTLVSGLFLLLAALLGRSSK